MMVVSQSRNSFLTTKGLFIRRVVREIEICRNDDTCYYMFPRYYHLAQRYQGECLGYLIVAANETPVAKFNTLEAAQKALEEAIKTAEKMETVRFDNIETDYAGDMSSDLWPLN